MRDWTRSLFRASFKGIPFWVERDGEEGGRRLVVHEFPMRDDPFVEDLGESARFYEVTAYLAGDASDGEAAALVAQLAGPGPGVLVLPTYGAILARCQTFKRDWNRDRLGYVAFTLKFVREGAASPLVSVASLANLVFIAVDAIVTALRAKAARAILLRRQPDYVVEAAAGQLREIVSLAESVRLSTPIDLAESAVARDELDALYRDIPVLLSSRSGVDPDFVDRLFAAVRRIGDAVEPALLVKVYGPLVEDLIAEPSGAARSVLSRRADANRAAVLEVGRLAFLSAYAEAVVQADYPSRREGITARANVAELFEREMEGAAGAENADLYLALQDLQGRAVEYLTRRVADLAPVVTVTAARSMPSLWWAWRLYGDPGRATELVTRNSVAHPSFMPTVFEALSR